MDLEHLDPKSLILLLKLSGLLIASLLGTVLGVLKFTHGKEQRDFRTALNSQRQVLDRLSAKQERHSISLSRVRGRIKVMEVNLHHYVTQAIRESEVTNGLLKDHIEKTEPLFESLSTAIESLKISTARLATRLEGNSK